RVRVPPKRWHDTDRRRAGHRWRSDVLVGRTYTCVRGRQTDLRNVNVLGRRAWRTLDSDLVARAPEEIGSVPRVVSDVDGRRVPGGFDSRTHCGDVFPTGRVVFGRRGDRARGRCGGVFQGCQVVFGGRDDRVDGACIRAENGLAVDGD